MPHVIWAGHTTVRIELGGATLPTDPLLRRRPGPLVRRGPVPAGVAGDLDAVLVSHLRRDHLEMGSPR